MGKPPRQPVEAGVAVEPDLDIRLEEVCFVVVKARELNAKDAITEPDPGSNPSDDGAIAVLEDHGDDPAGDELQAAIETLSDEGQLDLLALTLLGRGDFEPADWQEARRTGAVAAEGDAARYLLGMPLLADYLEEGLSMFGLSCQDIEAEHL